MIFFFGGGGTATVFMFVLLYVSALNIIEAQRDECDSVSVSMHISLCVCTCVNICLYWCQTWVACVLKFFIKVCIFEFPVIQHMAFAKRHSCVWCEKDTGMCCRGSVYWFWLCAGQLVKHLLYSFMVCVLVSQQCCH